MRLSVSEPCVGLEVFSYLKLYDSLFVLSLPTQNLRPAAHSCYCLIMSQQGQGGPLGSVAGRRPGHSYLAGRRPDEARVEQMAVLVGCLFSFPS